MPSLDYEAPPTCAAFASSNSFFRLIAGPVGSGKTTACIMELLRRAIEQAPGQDGLRYTRFAVVRQTLRQLRDTVLRDARVWLQGLGEWKVSDNTFYLEFANVRSEWLFIPLENPEEQSRLLSAQLTGAWISEGIESDFGIIAPIAGRMPRYPFGNRGAPTWYGIIIDTNFPQEDTPWWNFMENPPANAQIFKQPSGLDPPVFDVEGEQTGGAENLNWLGQTADTLKLPVNHPLRLAQGRSYYERYLETFGENHPWVLRYVKAQYGADPSGEAVFGATFDRSFHVVPELDIIPGYPLIIGQDFGRNPWSLICQLDHRGRLLVLKEIEAHNCSIEKHVTENLIPVLRMPPFLGCKLFAVCDPSGAFGSQTTEETCVHIMRRLGVPTFPAPTNDINPRLRAVESFLVRQTGGHAAILFSLTGCPKTIQAMGGSYRFKKRKSGALEVKPDKDQPEGYSHVMDDLQYVCLVAGGGQVHEFARYLAAPRRGRPREPVNALGWT